MKFWGGGAGYAIDCLGFKYKFLRSTALLHTRLYNILYDSIWVTPSIAAWKTIINYNFKNGFCIDKYAVFTIILNMQSISVNQSLLGRLNIKMIYWMFLHIMISDISAYSAYIFTKKHTNIHYITLCVPIETGVEQKQKRR